VPHRLLTRLRVRDRAAGDRVVRRIRGRPDLPWPGGTVAGTAARVELPRQYDLSDADLRVRVHGVRVAFRGARPRRGAGRLPGLRRDERLPPVLLLRRARREQGRDGRRRRVLRRLLRLRSLTPCLRGTTASS